MSPISFLSRRYRAQRLGRVRLGIKKVSKTGKEYPAATPYFVLGDAPALQEIYGDQPTSLNVEFLWDNLDLTFPNYMRRYTASGLRCLGDGEVVLYRVNDDGDVDVRDGNLLHPNGKVVMGEDNQPVKVACKGEYCPFYEDSSCKPTGYLRFLPVEAPRLGYYDLVCHQRAVVGILTQLKLTLANFHHLTGIPFILHRGDEEKVPVKVPGKGMVDMPVRTQWIEIDPGWFAENWPQREVHRALAAGRVRQDVIELFGEDSNGDNLLPPPAIQEAAALVFEVGEQGETIEPSAEMPPEETKKTPERPAPPAQVADWLRAKSRMYGTAQASDGQRGLMVGLLNKILGGDPERRSWLNHVWGETSSKGLRGGSVLATLDWLKAEKDADTGEWIPHPYAVSEARTMLREAMVEAGQQDMFEADEKAAEEEAK